MLTDIEIAQQCRMRPITEIAATAGIDEEYLEQYGRYKAISFIPSPTPLHTPTHMYAYINNTRMRACV